MHLNSKNRKEEFTKTKKLRSRDRKVEPYSKQNKSGPSNTINSLSLLIYFFSYLRNWRKGLVQNCSAPHKHDMYPNTIKSTGRQSLTTQLPEESFNPIPSQQLLAPAHHPRINQPCIRTTIIINGITHACYSYLWFSQARPITHIITFWQTPNVALPLACAVIEQKYPHTQIYPKKSLYIP